MAEVDRDVLAEFLKHRKACDLCLRERCNKKCKHAKNYCYGYIERMYDEAIALAVNYESSKNGEMRTEVRRNDL